jgi:hypothetical protein
VPRYRPRCHPSQGRLERFVNIMASPLRPDCQVTSRYLLTLKRQSEILSRWPRNRCLVEHLSNYCMSLNAQRLKIYKTLVAFISIAIAPKPLNIRIFRTFSVDSESQGTLTSFPAISKRSSQMDNLA